jgi:hypothetical protein
MRWFRNGKVLKECEMPQIMQGKTVFLSIVMLTVGDEAEISA